MCFSSPDRGLHFPFSHCQPICLTRLISPFIALHFRLHRRLMGPVRCFVLLSEQAQMKVVYFLCRKKWEHRVRGFLFIFFLPPSNCVSWIGHAGWVCKGGCLYGCIWLHAELGPWPDGKERQEARIFCKVRDSIFVPSSFKVGIFSLFF